MPVWILFDISLEREEDAVDGSNEPPARAKLAAVRSLFFCRLSLSDFLAAAACAGVLDAAIRCLNSRCLCAFDFGGAIFGLANGVADVDAVASCTSMGTLLRDDGDRSVRFTGSSGWSAMV